MPFKMSRWVYGKMGKECVVKRLDGCLVNGWRFSGKICEWVSSEMGGVLW